MKQLVQIFKALICFLLSPDTHLIAVHTDAFLCMLIRDKLFCSVCSVAKLINKFRHRASIFILPTLWRVRRATNFCGCTKSGWQQAALIDCWQIWMGAPLPQRVLRVNQGFLYFLNTVSACVPVQFFMLPSKASNADGWAICVESKPCIQTWRSLLNGMQIGGRSRRRSRGCKETCVQNKLINFPLELLHPNKSKITWKNIKTL